MASAEGKEIRKEKGERRYFRKLLPIGNQI